MDLGTGWESVAIFPESVILIDDTLRMWYLGINPGTFVVRSGYATSSDGGVEWTKYDGNPVLHVGEAGAWDDVTAAVGAVLFDGTTYEMWYDSWDGANSGSIGYATSLHGLLEVTVSPTTYVVPGTDSVVVTALFTSDTTGLGLFAEFEASDHTTLDSVRLYDDGAHHDGAADDSLFGNVWPVPPDERLYNIGLKATLNDTEIINYDDLARFTTIGPLEYAADSLAYRSTEPDKTYNPRIYLRLRNAGSMATATGIITARLSALDTCVTAISSDIANFDDIPAGGSVMSSGPFSSGYFEVSYNQNCPIGTEVSFAVSISSDGYAFWSDTFDVIITQLPLGIADAGGVLPIEFALHQNYPNPFNPGTVITYALPQAGSVTLVIYDLRGREIARLVDAPQQVGYHSVTWNGVMASGRETPSGIYIARLVTPEYTKSIKMVLLK
ncbi:MAG: T9SS type A sorting domain-containing protein [Candidatus Marinimicrobia bacterium]|nr:T9SS type A sorting domain-containing protein [Candidatus Neomarinimicrobiota bacterium]